jgi:hypothetical protein
MLVAAVAVAVLQLFLAELVEVAQVAVGLQQQPQELLT